MTKPFINEWIELVRPLFPKDAIIEVGPGKNDATLRIDWKLGNDPARPNKRSRIIKVIVSKEAMDDCRDSKTAGLKFRKVIENKLSTFNPDHNTPMHGITPIEEWIVSTFDIN